MKNPYQTPSSDCEILGSTKNLEEIVRYWEKRRVIYNLIQLVAGIVMLALTKTLFVVPVEAAVVTILFYAVAANIMYTLGPYLNITGIVYLHLQVKAWPLLFYAGLLFSTLLTALLAGFLRDFN